MSQKGGAILEFHTCDFFPERWFNLVVVLRCNNTNLYDRLKDRGYTEEKIKENVECEIFEEVANQAQESYKEDIIIQLDSESVDQVEANVESIIERLKTML